MMAGYLINLKLKDIPVEEIVHFFKKNNFLGELAGLKVSKIISHVVFINPIREKQTSEQLEEEMKTDASGGRVAWRSFDHAAAVFYNVEKTGIEAYRATLLQSLKDKSGLQILDALKLSPEEIR